MGYSELDPDNLGVLCRGAPNLKSLRDERSPWLPVSQTMPGGCGGTAAARGQGNLVRTTICDSVMLSCPRRAPSSCSRCGLE